MKHNILFLLDGISLTPNTLNVPFREECPRVYPFRSLSGIYTPFSFPRFPGSPSSDTESIPTICYLETVDIVLGLALVLVLHHSPTTVLV